MTDQKRMEIVKALAYGETPAAIAQVEGVSVDEVEAIAQQDAQAVTERKRLLKEAGYLEGD